MKKKEVTITIFPEIGKPYKVIIPINAEGTGFKQVNEWINRNLNRSNFVDWELEEA